MKIESQVCSLEFAKRLEELGVKQESIFVWEYYNDQCYAVKYYPYSIIPDKYNKFEIYSAFTVAELGEMLPPFNIVTYKYNKGNKILYEVYVQDIKMEKNKIYEPSHKGFTETNARAKLLIYLLENKLI